MKKILVAFAVVAFMFGGLIDQADAYSVEATFYLDGVDLDLGKVHRIPNTLLLIHGKDGEIERIIKPKDYYSKFHPDTDIHFEFDFSIEPEGLPMIFARNDGGENGIDGMLVLRDTSLDEVQLGGDLGGDFIDVSTPVGLQFERGDVVVLRTADLNYFLLGNFEYAVMPEEIASGKDGTSWIWPITFDVEVVPEPSTVLLVGLGLFGLLGLARRRKKLVSRTKKFLFILAIVGWGILDSVSPATAQFFDCATVTEIPQNECDALIALYDSTNGDNWTNTVSEDSPWKGSNTPCSWYGVTCDEEPGTVIELILSNNNLSGKLPAELGDLVNLGTLKLDGNSLLSGSLPSNLMNTSPGEFCFDKTALCEPALLPGFQDWKNSIGNWRCNDDGECGALECVASEYEIFSEYGDTWRDASADPGNIGDDNMCWAFSSSNILDWTGWGVPESDPDLSTAETIFSNAYLAHWENKGGMMKYAWNWWFDGTHPLGASGTEWTQLIDPDNEYVDGVFKDRNGRHWPDYQFAGYYASSWKKNVMAAVVDYLHGGYGVALRLYDQTNSLDTVGHALNVWGYRVYDDGTIIALYVTDSKEDVVSGAYWLPVSYTQEFSGEKLHDLKWRIAGDPEKDPYGGWLIEGVQALKPKSPLLKVRKAGTGSGTVTGDGINCGADCGEVYPETEEIEVTLTARADAGSEFLGWLGVEEGECPEVELRVDKEKCPEEYSCLLTVSGERYVVPVFERISDSVPEIFNITIVGTGVSVYPAQELEVPEGFDETIVFVPESGQQIVDVLIDGDSAGAIGSYTFPSVGTDHHVEIKIQEADNKFAIVTKKCVDESGTEIACPPGNNGTIIVGKGEQNCDAECMRITAEFAKKEGLMIQVVPGDGNSFEGWELSNGERLGPDEDIYYTEEDLSVRPVIGCSGR